MNPLRFSSSTNNNSRLFDIVRTHLHFLPSFSPTFPRKLNFCGKSSPFNRFTVLSSPSSHLHQNPSQELAVLLEVEGYHSDSLLGMLNLRILVHKHVFLLYTWTQLSFLFCDFDTTLNSFDGFWFFRPVIFCYGVFRYCLSFCCSAFNFLHFHCGSCPLWGFVVHKIQTQFLASFIGYFKFAFSTLLH